MQLPPLDNHSIGLPYNKWMMTTKDIKIDGTKAAYFATMLHYPMFHPAINAIHFYADSTFYLDFVAEKSLIITIGNEYPFILVVNQIHMLEPLTGYLFSF